MVAGPLPARAHADRVERCADARPRPVPDLPSSHVIVPAWYVPRRAYTVQVIGAVLLGPVNQVPRSALAERLRVPLGTAHDWLRRARRGAAGLISHVIAMAPGTPITAPVRKPEPGRTGIDYSVRGQLTSGQPSLERNT